MNPLLLAFLRLLVLVAVAVILNMIIILASLNGVFVTGVAVLLVLAVIIVASVIGYLILK